MTLNSLVSSQLSCGCDTASSSDIYQNHRSDVIAMTRYEKEAISIRHFEVDLTLVLIITILNHLR